MEALLCNKLGDPTVAISESSPLVISRSHPLPRITSPTAVRVRIAATSLNYANYLQILGRYQEKLPLPFVPGSDYSGVVESIGSAVSTVKIGDKVCSFVASDSFCEFIVVDEKELFLVPDGCDLVAAGALPVAYGTSHLALVHRAHLKPGQVLLVLGAAGGVGLSAVQIGKVCGAIVIAVARGDEKVRFLQSLGVDFVVDLSKGNIIESVKNFLKTRNLKGVDVLYDPVGGKLTKESMKLLNWGANILIIGFASGEIPIIPANIALVKVHTDLVVENPPIWRDKVHILMGHLTAFYYMVKETNWTVHGLYWGSYNRHNPQLLRDSLRELLSWLSNGLISIHISHSYSLQEANLAFAAIRDRKAIGKVMVIPGSFTAGRSKL